MDPDTRPGRRGRYTRCRDSSRSAGGLRLFSLKVVEKIQTRVRTTYNAVANELVSDLNIPGANARDGKSIRRRCYDAINVLLACGLIKRDDRKQIVWRGHGNVEVDRLRAEVESRRQAVEHKRQLFQDVERKHKTLEALLERGANRQPESLDSGSGSGLSACSRSSQGIKITLPFMLVQARAGADVQLCISDDKTNVEFELAELPQTEPAGPNDAGDSVLSWTSLQLHDDCSVVMQLKQHEAERQANHQCLNPRAGLSQGTGSAQPPPEPQASAPPAHMLLSTMPLVQQPQGHMHQQQHPQQHTQQRPQQQYPQQQQHQFLAHVQPIVTNAGRQPQGLSPPVSAPPHMMPLAVQGQRGEPRPSRAPRLSTSWQPLQAQHQPPPLPAQQPQSQSQFPLADSYSQFVHMGVEQHHQQSGLQLGHHAQASYQQQPGGSHLQVGPGYALPERQQQQHLQQLPQQLQQQHHQQQLVQNIQQQQQYLHHHQQHLHHHQQQQQQQQQQQHLQQEQHLQQQQHVFGQMSAPSVQLLSLEQMAEEELPQLAQLLPFSADDPDPLGFGLGCPSLAADQLGYMGWPYAMSPDLSSPNACMAALAPGFMAAQCRQDPGRQMAPVHMGVQQ